MQDRALQLLWFFSITGGLPNLLGIPAGWIRFQIRGTRNAFPLWIVFKRSSVAFQPGELAGSGIIGDDDAVGVQLEGRG